jgi:hypothetical protein
MNKNKKYFEIVITNKEPFISQGKRTYKVIFRFYNDKDEIIINDICYTRNISGNIRIHTIVSPFYNPDLVQYNPTGCKPN